MSLPPAINAVPPRIVVVRLNDVWLQVNGLQDSVTLAYYNNGTLTATLVDQNGDAVPGFSVVSLVYVAGSQGNYRGLIEQTFNPPLGGGYTLQITATVPGGAGPDGTTDGYWEIPTQVVPRTN